MENKNLVLTSIKQNFSNETENLLLGNWCQDFSEDNNKKNSIADNHWSLNEKRIKDANYLKKLNEKVLDFFFENLNNIHKKDNTKRYWRILIGPFLYDLIPIIFDRWETVRYFFEKQSIKEIKVKTFKEKNFKSNFYSINSIQSLWFNDEINQKIFNKILEENYGELIKFDFFELREKTKQFTEKKSWKESYYEFLSNILLKLNFYKFLFKFNFCIFDSRIMSNFKFFKLNLKLKNIPLTNFFFFSILEKNFKKENNLNKKLIQNDLRPLLKKKVSRFTRDKFETFLLNILIDLFPEVYLERYNQSLELISSYVIKKPKVIFSKYLIFYNDIYKLWVAEMVERKSILIVSDHGGFVPLFEHTLLKHESKISDYHFIPHDFILASNNLKLPTILNIYKKKFSNLKSSNNLTFIHRECGLYNHKLCSNIPVPNIFIEFKNFTRSIEFLEKKIKDKVRYKCINNTKAYLRQSFSKKYGDKKIINPNEVFKKTVKNSKILVHLYIGTPFYESLHFNVPSLLLIPKGLWIFDDRFKYYLDKLEKKNILFYEAEKISEHINKIWGKPSEWWLKEDIQSLKTKFLNVINCDDPDPVKKYYKTLQNIYKDRHEKN